MAVSVREMTLRDIEGAVALQRLCFPEPFPQDLLWNEDHLRRHLELFPEGQFVAISGDVVVGSASNTRIGRAHYDRHLSWDETAGGPFLKSFDPNGQILYGLDISVHPDFRRQGIGRLLYEHRFRLVRLLRFDFYATACRLPDFAAWSGHEESELQTYLREVTVGDVYDRTLTPLLRYGLKVVDGLHDYMVDEDSLDCAALLEWHPDEEEP